MNLNKSEGTAAAKRFMDMNMAELFDEAERLHQANKAKSAHETRVQYYDVATEANSRNGKVLNTHL